MDTREPATQPGARPPNHHAHHRGFSGLFGVIAALTMVRREGDAELVCRLSELRPGDRVVDVGCGPGTAARRAARQGAHVIGIDPAPVMLRVARWFTRRGTAVDYRLGAAESLPLDDQSATVVWSIASVHHWPALDDGLREARRVLEPGGRFVAVERETQPGATGHASHGWTSEQADTFAERCRAAGFGDVRVEHHRAGKRRLVAVIAVRT